ncbi:DUF2334 domain-containing protein [Actinokineospora sp. G85]|uniref:DUF2334 domain-containing protein n=1 Tax=Actinokineospora sp. G85 TaxID=3406626 RepID=UPI003C787D36
MTARLVVSLSGTSDRTLPASAEFADELSTRGVPLTVLFAPGLTGPETNTWARTADSVLVHGWNHAANPAVRRRRAEFAALPAHESALRLTAAMSAVERAGLVVDGFTGPRWQVSQGARGAVRARGLRLCADQVDVHDLVTGIRHRGRVQSLRGGERAEMVRCFALVLSAARTARRGGLLRLAVDVTDLQRPGHRQAVLDAVDTALDSGAVPSTYLGLLGTILVPEQRAPLTLPDRIRG